MEEFNYVTDVFCLWILEINMQQVRSVLTPDWEEVLEDDYARYWLDTEFLYLYFT